MIAGWGKANSEHPLLVLPTYGYILENGKVVLNGVVAKRAKMALRCTQDRLIVDNGGDRGRMFLLMFTLGGFGGAAAVIAAEEIIASGSSGGTAFTVSEMATRHHRQPARGQFADAR